MNRELVRDLWVLAVTFIPLGLVWLRAVLIARRNRGTLEQASRESDCLNG